MFSKTDVDIIEAGSVFGKFLKLKTFQLRHRLFDGGWSAPITREVLERGNSVGVLLYDLKTLEVIFVEQFRLGAYFANISPWLLEIPAGVIEAGELPEAVGIREVYEETGATITELQKVGSCILSPGGCSEVTHLFASVVDSTTLTGIHGLESEHENIRIVKMPISEAFKLLDSTETLNATVTITLQWLKSRLTA